MSCFVMNINHLAYLGHIIADLVLNAPMDFNLYGFSVPDSLCKVLAPNLPRKESVYEDLYRLNARSYENRYERMSENEKHDLRLVPTTDHDFQADVLAGAREKVTNAWHFNFLKLVECWLYQSCEGDAKKAPLYKAMEDLKAQLLTVITHNDPHYAGSWGDISLNVFRDNGKTSIGRYVVVSDSYNDGPAAVVCRDEATAMQEMQDDAANVERELTEEGHTTVQRIEDETSIEVYVPDTSINYTWMVLPANER